jgi:hypothetical protein
MIALVSGCADPDEAPHVIDSPQSPPTAAELRARIATCDPVNGGSLATDDGRAATVSICGLSGAVFWKADLDIDCDGMHTDRCNRTTDPSYQNQTAATDSRGNPLDAASLPYVVLPGKSTRFDYRAAGLALGSVFAVIYRDTLIYGVAGDIGPSGTIGEASYRMAELLGIDPDPRAGGTDEEVVYIGFTGATAVIDPIEDTELATSIGIEHVRALL